METQVLVSKQKEFVLIDSLSSEKNYKIDPLIASANEYLKNRSVSTALKLGRDFKLSVDSFNLKKHTKDEVIKFVKRKNAIKDSIRELGRKEVDDYHLAKRNVNTADSINQAFHHQYDRVKVKHENNFSVPIWFIGYLFILGGILTVFGGASWYIKIQAKQDRILELQLQQLELEVNKKTKITGRYHFEPQNRPKI